MVLFFVMASVTLIAAVAAVAQRNLVHCALSLAVAFAGLAAVFLHLQAPFIAFAQVLVYIGAVAILILFAILLTRQRGAEAGGGLTSGWRWGMLVAGLFFGVLAVSIMSAGVFHTTVWLPAEPSVRNIGDQLMQKYVLPLQAVGLLLTAALLGSILIAMQRRPEAGK